MSPPSTGSQPAVNGAETRTRLIPRITIEHIWISLPFVILLWYGLANPLRLLDFWWHLAAGRLISTSGAIPRADPFSFTAAAKPFIFQCWLAEVVYYRLYEWGGLPLVIAFNALLVTAALVPVWRLAFEICGGVRLTAIATLPATLVLVAFSHTRAQVFSFFFFSLFCWCLFGYLCGRRRRLWLLPGSMALWVNLHGAFPLGLLLIGLFLGTELVRRIVLGPGAGVLSLAELRRLSLTGVATAAATLLNPEGYGVYRAVTAVLSDKASQSFVMEWQPTPMNRFGVLVFFLPLVLTGLLLLYSRLRPRLIEAVLFFAFLLLALSAVRNDVWFALVLPPLLARHLQATPFDEVLRPLRRFRTVDALHSWVERRVGRSSHAPIRYGLNTIIAAVLLEMTVIVSPWVRPHLGFHWWGESLWERDTPVAAMDEIARRKLKGNIFHPQVYGDYLVWRLWPAQRSFIDSRVHLFGKKFTQDYVAIFEDRDWEERLAPYDIRYLLLDKSDPLEEGLIGRARAAAGWKVFYEDDISVLLGRAQ
jgi:hypothetical protein